MKRLLVLIGLLIIGYLSQGQYAVDQKLGAQSAEMVKIQMGLYDSPQLEAYIQRVVDRLVDVLPEDRFEYQVKLVDQEEPNAFALPGGYLYVTRGVLAIINSEDQLAGILAHEIIHAQERHSIKQMKKGYPIITGILKLPGKLVGMFLPTIGSLLILPVEAGSAAIQADYSRKHEREADIYGIQVMARAGYDPAALREVLGNLGREVELLTGEEERGSIFSDHPITAKRLDYLKDMEAELTFTPSAPIESAFNSRIEGLLFGPNPQQGLIDNQEFKHPDLDLYLKFPEKWQVQNSPVALVAANPKETALISMTLGNSGTSIQDEIKMIEDTLKDYENLEILANESVQINGIRGHQISMAASKRKTSVHVDFFLMEKDGLHYRILGLSYADQRNALLDVIQSFRTLTRQEQNSIFAFTIGLEESRAGETLESFNARSASHWKAEFGAVANGIKTTTQLEPETSYKILERSLYTSEQ